MLEIGWCKYVLYISGTRFCDIVAELLVIRCNSTMLNQVLKCPSPEANTNRRIKQTIKMKNKKIKTVEGHRRKRRTFGCLFGCMVFQGSLNPTSDGLSTRRATVSLHDE
jgi:hypothetical protein